MPSTRNRTHNLPTSRTAGSKGVPTVVPIRPAPKSFDAKSTLRSTGMRLGDESRAAGRTVKSSASAGAGIANLGDASFGGVGDFVLAIVGGILGLIMLELLIGNRGSSITSAALKWTGSTIGRIVSPTDPLVFGSGAASSSPPPPTSSTPAAGVSAVGAQASGGAVGRPQVVPLSPFPPLSTLATPPTTKTGAQGSGG